MVTLAAVWAVFGAVPAAADDTYEVHTCRAPDGIRNWKTTVTLMELLDARSQPLA
jgi:hypothetical protein